MMFSPPFLISRPMPSPRKSQATRLVTSKARVADEPGFTYPWTHCPTPSVAGPAARQFSQPLGTGPVPVPPPPPAGGVGGLGGVSGDANAAMLDQALVTSPSVARTRH